jgi:TolB-like protein/DNA-binding winged helix-turn-helix (wHTH) protein/Tfp pilus assembly protein PilF
MGLATSTPGVLKFGVFHLDEEKNELTKFDAHIRLAPQPFRLLTLLASHHGEVVTREEIQEQLWGNNTFVDFERGMNHCIRQIRAVLGDDAGTPRYIETVPRLGYRFIAPVTHIAREFPSLQLPLEPHGEPYAPNQQSHNAPSVPPVSSGATKHRGRNLLTGVAAVALLLVWHLLLLPRWRTAHPPPQSPRPMLAVLPFDNLTGDPAQEYLSDGVTDEMIVHLGSMSPSHLGVIARTSAMSYKRSAKPLAQISHDLGVQYVLEGTVKESGPVIRITAQLVRSNDQTELWADTYDGQIDAGRILAFQQSVADRVAQSLSLVLPEVHVPQIATTNQTAYEDFLKGRYEWNKRDEDGFQQSIQDFKAAISNDPGYADAWAGLADSYDLSREYYEGRSSDEMPELGKDAAFKALTLDPTLSQARASLAFNLWRYEWKYPEAESEFRKALDLSPNNATAHHWYGMFLASRGRFDEARSQIKQARTLDPLSLIIITNDGWVSYYAHDYDAAVSSYLEALKLDGGSQTAQMKLAWAYEQKGMWQKALDARRGFYIAAGHPEIAQALSTTYTRSGYTGVLRAILAETEKSDAGPYYNDYEKARLYAETGDADKALALLERAYLRHSGWLVYVAVEPAFDKLHSNPRFALLVDRTVSAQPI